MGDRFLSRGKRIDNGEWVEGFPFLVNDVSYILPHHNTGQPIHVDNLLSTSVEVSKDTICRCTGRTDRDEKLIFEHDVIVFLDTYSTESGYAEADCAGEVLWDEESLSFQVTNRLSAESYEVLDECSVIGNIFDNFGLLESEE